VFLEGFWDKFKIDLERLPHEPEMLLRWWGSHGQWSYKKSSKQKLDGWKSILWAWTIQPTFVARWATLLKLGLRDFGDTNSQPCCKYDHTPQGPRQLDPSAVSSVGVLSEQSHSGRTFRDKRHVFHAESLMLGGNVGWYCSAGTKSDTSEGELSREWFQ